MTFTEQELAVAMKQPVLWRTQFADGSGAVYINEHPLVLQISPADIQTHQILEIHLASGIKAHYIINNYAFGTNNPYLTLTRLNPQQAALFTPEDPRVIFAQPIQPQPGNPLVKPGRI